MQNDLSNATLFEVSWEVCNKVGGIYTVVTSKALEAVKQFGDNYYMIGPDLGNNAEFEETDEACWDILHQATEMVNINCRFGRWDIPGRPKVILVSFKDRYNQSQLLYDLWTRYSVDSLSGGWDYIEPVMFSTVCGEVIAAACQELADPNKSPVLAHFHEWMCGGGLLEIKRRIPQVGTVFTTHATMLGRSMAGSGFDIYKQMSQINPKQEASSYNITAKCSMETASAREADCFTTVSHITADEGVAFLGRKPDVITTNGIDLSIIPDFSASRTEPDKHRQQIIGSCSRLLRYELEPDTKIFLISGRYEFHNKGIDAFMEALAGVNEALRGSNTKILGICAVMGGHNGVNMDAISGDPSKPSDQGPYWISSHHVYNQPNDPILRFCSRLGLDNRPDNNVKIVFNPALLDGHDGFFNLNYEKIMSACDMGVFPSWYEPWGYTPQESAALSVPTVTTDLSGFGHWVRSLGSEADKGGVIILPRRQTNYEETVSALKNVLLEAATLPANKQAARRRAVRELSNKCSWQKFFPLYVEAYSKAIAKSGEREVEIFEDTGAVLTRLATANATAAPVLHTFNSVAHLPKNIERLRELAGNMWWCWNPHCWDLFADLDPAVWESSSHNPVLTLEKTTTARFAELSKDESYLKLYRSTMQEFDAYMQAAPLEFKNLRKRKPVAYFSMEYGFNECLPIYSGGLGVLSGDHLKSASDLNIPFVGVGLLYKSGYFRQYIDNTGRQVPLYPENNFNELPVERALDKNGDPLEVTLDLPGRVLYAQVWVVKVGRVPLYLMDTDTPKNTADDRKITARLYEADRDFRLRQEMLLGIGGIRMLRALGITPSVYHMNEGHSAFLILERIRVHMNRGLSFDEACIYVRGSNLFTTHTPVEAGNEIFTIDRMAPYFGPFIQAMGLNWNDFLRLGRLEGSERHVFEMTVFALNFSLKANGVSRMHGLVSRYMWQKLWQGVPTAEVPIGYVTNGIHVPTYAGPAMRTLLDTYLGEGWMDLPPESAIWDKIYEIPDGHFWSAKQIQKNMLLDRLRASLPNMFKKFDVPVARQKEMMVNLNSSALVIGFARRFAPYKRATLLFADPERLERILSDATKPIIFVFSGKAHPADTHGVDIMQQVINYSLDPRFFGKIFFIEDYSIAVSRQMVQGCDIWLNNPRRPHEASGTSGQKVSVNGGLNVSISDGWWCEGADGQNGWTIGPDYDGTLLPAEQNDYDDAESLYTLLEETIVPLYFNTDSAGLPHGWIQYSKRAMRTLTAQFHSNRMVNEYLQDYYTPAADRHAELAQDNNALTKSLASWKHDISGRFNSIQIEDIVLEGLSNDILLDTTPLGISVQVNPGNTKAHELLVQLVAGPGGDQGFIGTPDVVDLTLENEEGGKLFYTGSYPPTHNGKHIFGVRIQPARKGLYSPLSTGLILWG